MPSTPFGSVELGYGLRVPHYRELRERGTRAPFVEALAENFLGRGGLPLRVLERVRRDARVALHGVSLSIGGTDAINWDHVHALSALARELEAPWISDHLCFGSVDGHYAHDLWPLPYTEEAVQHVADRARHVQDVLGRRLILENVSSYVEWRASTMPEWEFIVEVARRAGVGLLLDVNNVVVSAKNHGFSADRYLAGLPPGLVVQMHLAGHSDYGTHAIDDHASPVPDVVWSLYRQALVRFGSIPTIVEWDDAIPTLSALEGEAERAGAIAAEVLSVPRSA
jgi:uncharacterized protein (UPF0276 family)